MNIQDKAQEFAEALADTSEFKEFYNAHENVRQDEEANRLLNEFQNAQIEIQKTQMSGQNLEQDRIMEIQELQEKFQENQNIQSLLQAQQKVQGLVQEINNNLSEVTGVDFAAFGVSGEGGGSSNCCG